MLKTLYLALLITGVICSAGADEGVAQPKLQPLFAYTEKLFEADEADFSNIAYIANRSGMLLLAVANYQQEKGTDEGKAAAIQIKEKAEMFLAVGQHADKRIGKSDDVRREQLELFLRIYTDSIKENKLLNNTFMSPLIAQDLAAAKTVGAVFQRFANRLNEQE